jgi:FMN phosphatase YigB (HAD superfamily)
LALSLSRLTIARPRSIGDLEAVVAEHDPGALLVDCFGTLLHRSVPSGRVRWLASHDLATWLDTRLEADDLEAVRLELEGTLSERSRHNGFQRDFRLSELACALHASLIERFGHVPVGLEPFVQRFLEIETAVETSITEPNRALAELLADQSRHRPVVLVSDTNLTRPVLLQILATHGLEGIFHAVYPSSEHSGTKRSGELYEVVASDLGLPTAALLMVGDNPHVDQAQAAARGVASVIVSAGRWDTVKDAPNRVLGRSLDRDLHRALRPTGAADVFPELALTLFAFVHLLHQRLSQAGATLAVFVTREGQLLRRLFEAYQLAYPVPACSRIDSVYLPISRKAAFVAAAPADPDEALGRLLRKDPRITGSDVEQWLTGGGGAVAGATWAPETPPLGDMDLQTLGKEPAFRHAYDAHRRNQRQLTLALLEPLLGEPGSSLHVVDIGWKGTVQDYLQELLAARTTVTGYYLGISAGGPISNLSHKHGLMFTNQPIPSRHFEVFNHFKTLYEGVLTADHGSVARYATNDAGEPTPVFDEHPDESLAFQSVVGPVQTLLEERFVRLARLLARNRLATEEVLSMTARHHARMAYRPTRREIAFVQRLVHYENFGHATLRRIGRSVDGTDTGGIAPARGALLRRHIHGGGWPPLRMVRAGQGWLRFPYGWYKTAAILVRLRRPSVGPGRR